MTTHPGRLRVSAKIPSNSLRCNCVDLLPNLVECSEACEIGPVSRLIVTDNKDRIVHIFAERIAREVVDDLSDCFHVSGDHGPIRPDLKILRPGLEQRWRVCFGILSDGDEEHVFAKPISQDVLQPCQPKIHSRTEARTTGKEKAQDYDLTLSLIKSE